MVGTGFTTSRALSIGMNVTIYDSQPREIIDEKKTGKDERFSTVSQDFSKEKLRVRGLHRVIDIWKSVERSFRQELGIMAGGIRWLLTSRR